MEIVNPLFVNTTSEQLFRFTLLPSYYKKTRWSRRLLVTPDDTKHLQLMVLQRGEWPISISLQSSSPPPPGSTNPRQVLTPLHLGRQVLDKYTTPNSPNPEFLDSYQSMILDYISYNPNNEIMHWFPMEYMKSKMKGIDSLSKQIAKSIR